MNGNRKVVPSLYEIDCIRKAPIIPLEIRFVDGKLRTLDINSTTTVGEVIKKVSKLIQLKNYHGWALFENNKEYGWFSVLSNFVDVADVWLKPTDYIADVISSWEPQSAAPSPVAPASDKQKKKSRDDMGESIQTQEAFDKYKRKVVFKKRVFKNPKEIIVDLGEYHLLSAQAVLDLLADHYEITIQNAIELAAMNLRSMFSSFESIQANMYLLTKV